MHTLHVVREELALHASFFVRVPAGTAAENVGGGTALWHVWYDRLRPLVLQQTELDVLCEMWGSHVPVYTSSASSSACGLASTGARGWAACGRHRDGRPRRRGIISISIDISE